MPFHNFMMTDLAASLAAFCLFPLFVFIPGYVVAWVLDLISFRRRTLLFQVAFSITLSISVCPLATYLLGRFLGMPAVWAMFGCLWLCFAVLLVWGARRWASRLVRGLQGRMIFAGIATVWLIIGLASLIDMQIGHRLYYSVIAYDVSVRTAFVSAIATTGIPPQNPFYAGGHAAFVRYHYFWLILSALVTQISRGAVTARQAIFGGIVWSGIGLMALAALYIRLFTPHGRVQTRDKTVIAILLLGVTGLDILPTLLLVWGNYTHTLSTLFPSVEWWNEQVAGFLDTMLWEPHYIAGLITCFTAFLLLWEIRDGSNRRDIVKNGVVAGFAIASAVGVGLYIVFVFAVFLLVWTVISWRKKWLQHAAALLVAGVTSVVFSLPSLLDLLGPGPGGGVPIRVTVRPFWIPDMVLKAYGFDDAQLAIANAAFLPLNYFLEFGFYFAVAWLRFKTYRRRDRKLDRCEIAGVTMLIVSLFICTFLRSSVGNNDLGWRGLLIAQFILLLWSAELLAGWRRSSSGPPGNSAPLGQKFVLGILLFLGAAGTLYDLGSLRLYPLFSDWGIVPRLGTWMSDDQQLGERTYAVREAYEWNSTITRTNAVVQHDPNETLQDTAAYLYANRRAAAADRGCNSGFGGDPRLCPPIVAALQELYSGRGKPSLENYDSVCLNLPIDILVAKDTDAVWKDRNSWVWKQKPIFTNDYVRLFSCTPLEVTARR